MSPFSVESCQFSEPLTLETFMKTIFKRHTLAMLQQELNAHTKFLQHLSMLSKSLENQIKKEIDI